MKYGNPRAGATYVFSDDSTEFITCVENTIESAKGFQDGKYGNACFSEIYKCSGENMYLAMPYESKYLDYISVFENLFANIEIHCEKIYYFKEANKKNSDPYGSTSEIWKIVDKGKEVVVIWKIKVSDNYIENRAVLLYKVIGSMLRFFSSGESYVDDKIVEGDFIEWLLKLNNTGHSGHSIGDYIITPELIKKMDDIKLVNKCDPQVMKNKYLFEALDKEN